VTATVFSDVARTDASEPVERRRRYVRATLMGAAAAAGAYALLDVDVIPRPWAALLLVILVAAVPVSPGLTRRISVNGALLLGWFPLSWLVPWPVEVNHGAALVALGLAVLTAWVGATTRPKDALRRLVPTLGRVDALVLLSAAAALVTVRPWLVTRSPRDTLRLLIPGYDNAGHFDMFLMLRTHGATIDTLGRAPDGSGWSYDNYPQGFHALLATYGDLMASRVGAPAAELVLYSHAAAAVVTFATAVLVATVCSVPVLRSRPWVLLPAVALITSAFLWEPGARLLSSGFAGFWFASLCAAAAVVIALGAGIEQGASLATIAAVAALVTGVALAWTPLLMLAGPAVLAVWPTRRTLWSGSRPSWAYRRIALFLLALMALGVLRAVLMLVTTITVSEVVVAQGQVSGAPFPVVLVLFIVSVAALVRLCTRKADGTCADRRLWWLVSTPLGGFAALTVLLVLQMRTLGTSSYYFLKLLVGFELVLATLAAVAIAALVATTVRAADGAPLPAAAALVVAASVTQSLGHVAWAAAPMLHPWVLGTDRAGQPLDLTAMADGILASTSAARSGSNRVYVAVGRARGFDGVLPAAWHDALTGTLSRRAHDRICTLGGTFGDADAAAPYVRSLLAKDASVTVLVDPSFVESLRSSLGPELGRRVLTLPS
jgi:hypothetical protein